ncbi:MAG: hypothetical protein QM765_26110 [Myxococcales bacterium]
MAGHFARMSATQSRTKVASTARLACGQEAQGLAFWASVSAMGWPLRWPEPQATPRESLSEA